MLLSTGDAASSLPASPTPSLHGQLSYGEAEPGQKKCVTGLTCTY